MILSKSLTSLLVFTEQRFFPRCPFSSEKKGYSIYSENISLTLLSDYVRKEGGGKPSNEI